MNHCELDALEQTLTIITQIWVLGLKIQIFGILMSYNAKRTCYTKTFFYFEVQHGQIPWVKSFNGKITEVIVLISHIY